MKTLVVAAAAAAALLSIPAMASAQETSGVYGTIGYAHLDADDVNLGGVQGRLGYRFHPNFAVEGEAAFGINDDEINVGPGLNVDVELKHELAAFAVGYLPVSPNFDLLARVGYATASIEASGAGVSGDEDVDGFAYGVGAQFFFDGLNGIRGDYTHHDFEDDADADVWAIAYSRRF
ncbi:MAG TPA: porin family protein [Phenylobacterium sp.]